MEWLSILAAPLVAVFGFSTDAVLRIIGIKASGKPPVTEQEITVMIERGTRSGVFAPAEQTMVKRVFRMGDRTVGSLMTLTPDIMWIDMDDPFDENMKKLTSSVYSRIPVCRGDLDNVAGILRAKDMLRQCLTCGMPEIRDVLQEPVFVPETLPALKLLEKMKLERSHIILVADEYGTVKGLVTRHDILEAIIGELPSPDEPDEPYAVHREDGSWFRRFPPMSPTHRTGTDEGPRNQSLRRHDRGPGEKVLASSLITTHNEHGGAGYPGIPCTLNPFAAP